MIQEGNSQDQWSFPKGRPKSAEPNFDAALRGTWEETGVCPAHLWTEVFHDVRFSDMRAPYEPSH
eukprot:10421148-Alexandrium_andersonii.AAC.1